MLAYEVGDAMADFAGDFTELQAAAVSVLQVVIAFNVANLGLTQAQATAEFGRAFRVTKRVMKRLGPEARLAEVIAELHLK